MLPCVLPLGWPVVCANVANPAADVRRRVAPRTGDRPDACADETGAVRVFGPRIVDGTVRPVRGRRRHLEPIDEAGVVADYEAGAARMASRSTLIPARRRAGAE